ncbi:unnamed protein product [Blepharisma stoltei]|uniref:Uncharacterized protein n=1 Tax=Blepharisma stoltei TaxID=1481888 RepID=A0AAU9ITQ4_9CILI|nr:unnamed protein product [Blepharisma stoltei]
MKSFTQEDQNGFQGKIQLDNLARSNQFYVAQVSQMEVKISELKALVQAKDSEISYLKKRVYSLEEQEEEILRNSANISNQELSQLKSRNAALEEENQLLRNQLNQFEDISDMKIQFEHAKRMKDIFEQKYRDAKSTMIKAEMNFSSQEDTIKSEGFYKDEWDKNIYKTANFEDSTVKQPTTKETNDYNRKISEEKELYKRKCEEVERNFIDLKYQYEIAIEKIKGFESGLRSERSSSVSSTSISDTQSKSYRSLMNKNKIIDQIQAKNAMSPAKPTSSLSSPQSNKFFYKPQASNELFKVNPESPATKPPLSNKKSDFKIIPIAHDTENSASLDSTMEKVAMANSLLKGQKENKQKDPLSISMSSFKKEHIFKDVEANPSFGNRNNPILNSAKKAEYCPVTLRNMKAGVKKPQFVIDLDQNEKIS